MTILRSMGMDCRGFPLGHHPRLATTTREKPGTAVDAVSAALILADKTDVRRSRNAGRDHRLDIHDRVNLRPSVQCCRWIGKSGRLRWISSSTTITPCWIISKKSFWSAC